MRWDNPPEADVRQSARVPAPCAPGRAEPRAENRENIMAYLDLNSGFGEAPFASSGRAAPGATVPVRASFSGLEWSVILLAAKDRLSSLSQPGRISRAIGGLFGLGETSRLADPQLEALRRMAVQAWHYGYLLPASEIGRFIDAGFTVDQVEMLLASVSQRRSHKRRGEPRRGAHA
jgi:hypothetical protein